MTIEAPKAKKVMKKDCRNKIRLSMKSTPRNWACTTSFDSHRATNEQVQKRAQKYRKTANKLQNHKTSRKHFKEQIPILYEIHTKEFSLFNVFLVSAGQVEGLDIRRATWDWCKTGPNLTEKLKTCPKAQKLLEKLCRNKFGLSKNLFQGYQLVRLLFSLSWPELRS